MSLQIQSEAAKQTKKVSKKSCGVHADGGVRREGGIQKNYRSLLKCLTILYILCRRKVNIVSLHAFPSAIIIASIASTRAVLSLPPVPQSS